MSDALWGVSGVVLGALGQYLIDFFRHKRETKKQIDLDERRKALLKEALENPPQSKEWRKLSTLSRIVGADFETTTRLLIELGARGSEEKNDVWALLSNKPLGHTRN